MGIVLMIHSLVRWAIVVVAVIGIVWLAIGLIQKKSWDKMANGLLMGFSGLMDLQGLLGLILLIWMGVTIGWEMYRFEHLGVMFVAIFVGHLPARLKPKDDTEKYRNALLAITGAIVLVVLGVFVLPGSRWTFGG